jgi:hypothetical protein
MAGAMAWHYRPFPCSLVRRRVGGRADNSVLVEIQDQRRAEGEILGEDFRLDGPPMFALGAGRGLMGFLADEAFTHR